MSIFDSHRRHARVDVPAMLDGAAAELLWELVDLGVLVSVFRTSDGGALGVTITSDGRRAKEYFTDSDDLRDWLSEALEELSESARLAPTGNGAQRGRQKAV